MDKFTRCESLIRNIGGPTPYYRSVEMNKETIKLYKIIKDSYNLAISFNVTDFLNRVISAPHSSK